MIHETSINRFRALWGHTFYTATCTCAGLFLETDSRDLAESVARSHERSAW